MTNFKSQLCLGTAKLGDPHYGHGSSLPADHYLTLLKKTEDCKIAWLDTSERYGNSQQLIGEYIAQNSSFKISSKIDNLNPLDSTVNNTMMRSLKASIKKLERKSLELVYLHQHSLDVLRSNAIKNGLYEIKDRGLAQSVGASVYSKEEIDTVLEDPIFDWIQVSGNILDTSHISYIRSKSPKIKIAIRSIFLQGLILNPHKIGEHIPENKQLKLSIKDLIDLTSQKGVDLEQAAISFIVNNIKPDMVIFGTNVAAHVKKFSQYADMKLSSTLVSELKMISKTPKIWTNPKNWN